MQTVYVYGPLGFRGHWAYYDRGVGPTLILQDLPSHYSKGFAYTA